MDLDSRYPIYAVTTDKKLAKRFKQERDQSKFLYKVIERDDDIADNWLIHRRGQMLSEYSLETYVNKNTDRQEPRFTKVLATENEINFLNESMTSGTIVLRFCTYPPAELFDEETQEALRYLGYTKMARFYSSVTLQKTSQGYVDDPYDEDGVITELDCSYDQLGVFVYMHSDMLTPEFYDSIKLTDFPMNRPTISGPHWD